MKGYEHLLRRLAEERYMKGFDALRSGSEYHGTDVQMGVFEKAFRSQLDDKGAHAYLLFDESRNKIGDLESQAAYVQGVRDGFHLADFLKEREEDATPSEVASSSVAV